MRSTLTQIYIRIVSIYTAHVFSGAWHTIYTIWARFIRYDGMYATVNRLLCLCLYACFIFPIFYFLHLFFSFASFNALFSSFHHIIITYNHTHILHTQAHTWYTHRTSLCRLESDSCQYAGNVVCISELLTNANNFLLKKCHSICICVLTFNALLLNKLRDLNALLLEYSIERIHCINSWQNCQLSV